MTLPGFEKVFFSTSKNVTIFMELGTNVTISSHRRIIFLGSAWDKSCFKTRTSLGCNNGGGGGIISKVKRLVEKWIGTRKRLFSGSFATGVTLERKKLFPRHILLMHQHIHICPSSWALGICKNIGIWTYFASVAAESVGFSRHFCVLERQTCQFFYCT